MTENSLSKNSRPDRKNQNANAKKHLARHKELMEKIERAKKTRAARQYMKFILIKQAIRNAKDR